MSRVRVWGDRALFYGALTLCLLPLVLVLSLATQASLDDWDQTFYRPTYLALQNSLGMFVTQGLVVFPLALFLGVMAGLFDYPLRRLSLALSLFPAVLPSFISAIGVQSLNQFLSYEKMDFVDGFWGSVWTGSFVSLPLAILATFLAVKSVPKSEIESLRQIGGAQLVFSRVLVRTIPVTMMAVCVGGLIVLSDFGVSNIMGFHGVASEIQLNFASRFDFVVAAAKASLFLVFLVPLFAVLCGLLMNRTFHFHGILQRSTLMELSFVKGCLLSLFQLLVCTLGSIVMMIGLLQPLLRSNSMMYLEMVWQRYWESLGLTLFYGLGSGVVATLCGFVIASYFFARKSVRAKGLVVVVLTLCFMLPSGITALGVTWLGTQLPMAFDVIFRSELTVLLTMGIRFAPIATLLYFAGYSFMPAGQSEVSRLCRSSWLFSKWQLQMRTLWKWGGMSLLVCSVLTLADVGAITLVQPPGGESFGAYFFGSMDNSPEVLVSSMCVSYMATPLILVLLGGAVYFGDWLLQTMRGVGRS